MDSGAEVSLIHRRVFRALKNPPPLKKKGIHLQSVNGGSLTIDGCTNILIDIGGKKVNQKFYVVADMNRNVILGRDWLIQNGVRLYYDLGCLRIGKTYVPLEEDIHIATLVRLNSDLILKPQTSYLCKGKVKGGMPFERSGIYQVTAVKSGFIHAEPGINVLDSISKIHPSGRIPISIVNNTNRTYHIRKGCVVGRIEHVKEECLVTTHDILNRPDSDTTVDFDKDLKTPDKYRSVVTQLIKDNIDRFATKDSDLGYTNTIKMKIDTGQHAPIKVRPYKTPLKHRQVMKDAVTEMLEAGIISRSQSPWSFPVVLIDKVKDGTKRFCIDYRLLNRISKPISRSLPLIDTILATLGDAKSFTSLDLKSGYWQVLMDEQDKEKTSFNCEYGQFEFNRMPFGLSSAPAVFQELMTVVLEGLEDCAIAYLDDILIFAKTPEENLRITKIVLDRLRQHGLKLKLKKCQFLQPETNYLGFVINEHGVLPDPEKVAAIRSLPAPSSVRAVRSFVGCCSWYRRFLPNFSEIAEPLIKLTKKYSRFHWDKKCQAAFDYLKKHLSTVPLLAFPDVNKPYILYTDASATCIGACLCQPCDEEDSLIPGVKDEKPIYFLSHKLSPTQCRYSTIEREAFAIHYALGKLNQYLQGADFVVKTDHKPLKYLLESPMQNKRIQMWALSIAGYNCKIEYIKGTDNTCADLLSRVPKEEGEAEPEHVEPDIDDRAYQVNVLDSGTFNPRAHASCKVEEVDMPSKEDLSIPEIDMIKEQAADPEIVEIMNQLKAGNAGKGMYQKYIIMEDILYYISNPDVEPTIRLYLPTRLRPQVIQQYHDQAGHMGIDKTFYLLRTKYFFPNMYKELYTYITHCITCQSRSVSKNKPPLQETDIPPYPFAKLSLDLSGPHPTTLSGNKYIASFVDLYSGWPECFAVPDKKASTIAELLINEIFPRFGAPLVLLSDNGSENVNRIMKETLKELNIHHVTTSFYRPQSNAKNERTHRVLNDVLSKYIQGEPTTWDQKLNQSLAALRFHISESSKFSPFQLVYNRDVVLPVDNIMKPRRKYMGEDAHQVALENQHKVFTQVHRHLKKAKKRQATYADRDSKEVEFKVGDAVYYKNHQRKNKLDARWKPFYRIVEKRGPVTYIIRDQLEGTSIKAHAAHIKLANVDEWEIPERTTHGRPLRGAAYAIPPESETAESSDSEDELPLAVLARRLRKKRENSDDEEDVPVMERNIRQREDEQDESLSSDHSDNDAPSLPTARVKTDPDQPITPTDPDTETDMDIDAVVKTRTLKSRKTNKKGVRKVSPQKKGFKQALGLLQMVATMM